HRAEVCTQSRDVGGGNREPIEHLPCIQIEHPGRGRRGTEHADTRGRVPTCLVMLRDHRAPEMTRDFEAGDIYAESATRPLLPKGSASARTTGVRKTLG